MILTGEVVRDPHPVLDYVGKKRSARLTFVLAVPFIAISPEGQEVRSERSLICCCTWAAVAEAFYGKLEPGQWALVSGRLRQIPFGNHSRVEVIVRHIEILSNGEEEKT